MPNETNMPQLAGDKNAERARMGTTPELRLIFQFSAPAMMGFLSNALYNIVDRMFIGHWVGSPGLAALTVAFPIALFQGALATLVCAGGTSLLSRKLGAGDLEEAKQTMGNMMTLTATMTFLLCLGTEFFLDPVVKLCGATPDILGLSKTYLRIVLWGMALQFGTIVQNETIRALGRPRRAMESVVIGTMSNVALDWLFIAAFNWGVAGAAVATVIGQGLSLAWVSIDLWGKRAPLNLEPPCWKLRWSTVRQIAAVGFSPFIGTLFFSILMVLFNLILSEYGGSLALSAQGIFFSLDSLLFLPVMGLGDGVLPLVGFNYGAGNLRRVKRLVSIALWSSGIFLAATTIITEIWAESMVALFSSGNPALTVAAARAMRLGYSAMPLAAISITASYVLQGLGRAKESLILTLGRQLIILPPVLILPRFLGTDGLWVSFPITDILGGVIAAWLLHGESKRWVEPAPRPASQEE